MCRGVLFACLGLVLVSLLLGGCAKKVKSAPVPAGTGEEQAPAGTPEEKQPAVEKILKPAELYGEEVPSRYFESVYYGASGRIDVKDPRNVVYTSVRSKEISLGVCHLKIKKSTVFDIVGRELGRLLRGAWSRLPDDSVGHEFQITEAIPYSKEQFFESVNEELGLYALDENNEKNMLLFIHGFNNSFEEAVERTGCIASYADFKGVAVAYVWPSKENFLLYFKDRAVADWSAFMLQLFIVDYLLKSDAKYISVIAHSMGGEVFVKAYCGLIDQAKSDKKLMSQMKKIKRIILASPDIDYITFLDFYLKKMRTLSPDIYLYFSQTDSALKLSQGLQGTERLGSSLVCNKEIVCTDTSSVNSDFFNHATIASSKTVLEDLMCIFNEKCSRNQQKYLESRPCGGGLSYWRLNPAGN